MASVLDQIQSEADALAQDMERAATMSTQLAELLGEARVSVAGLEEKAASLFTSAVEQVHSLETKILDRAAAVVEAADHLTGELEGAAKAVEEATGEMETAAGALQDSIGTATQDASTLDETVRTVRSEVSEAAAAWGEEIATGISELGERVQDGEQALEEFGTAIENFQQAWRDFVSEMADRLRQAMEQVGEHVDTHIGVDMMELVNSFEQRIAAVIAESLSEPLTRLQEEAIQVITQELRQLADEAMQAVEETLRGAMDDILGAKDESDAKQRVMRELLDQLRPVFDAIEAQLEPVKGIAAAVGVDI